MADRVDGFELEFTSRTSWKASRAQHGQFIDIVPVGEMVSESYLQVWYRNQTKWSEHA